MPTFVPDENQRATYRAMTSSIEQGRASYLKARAIVIDLRGNEGGSSDWSLQLAKALWGATVVDAKIRARDEKTSI